MIKLNMPVIVEGKYDKIALENVIDALIIPTNGFSIFKNKEKSKMIRNLAAKNGIIVMTDSDSAGSMIRAYLKNIVGTAPIINVYVPQLKGKEKRKDKPSKEGFLGVEGMSQDVIRKALLKSGINGEECPKTVKDITKNTMFKLGLSGSADSSKRRKELLKYLELPENLSSSAMLDVINNNYSCDEFERLVFLWQNEEGRN